MNTARFEQMTPTRRRVRGVISDLVELEHDGDTFVAVVYHDDFRHADLFSTGAATMRDFLELPMVDGIAPLVASLPSIVVYRTGSVRTVRELVGVYAEEGGTGARAALELFAQASRALIDAAQAARARGLANHGSLSPLRLAVTDDGGVVVLGYGLPMLDVEAFHADASTPPSLDSLRYCPPERLTSDPEDVTSDLFGLALIVAELATGRPVYLGRSADVLAAAKAGTASAELTELPLPLRTLLEGVLSGDPSQRAQHLDGLVARARAAARQAEGSSLRDLVQRAQEYLSDVEDELPSGFRLQDLLPPDTERDEAGRRASAAAVRADAALTSLDAFVRGAMERVEPGSEEVDRAVEEAQQAVAEAKAKATEATEAAEQAAKAPDGERAKEALARAQAASETVKASASTAREALERAAQLTLQHHTDTIERHAAQGRLGMVEAQRLCDEASAVERHREPATEAAHAATEAATRASEGRDPAEQEAALVQMRTILTETLEPLARQGRAVREAVEAAARIQAVADLPDTPDLTEQLEAATSAVAAAQTAETPEQAEEAAQRAASAQEVAEEARSAAQAKRQEDEAHVLRAQTEADRAAAAAREVAHDEVLTHAQTARQAALAAAGAPAEAEGHAEEARRAADAAHEAATRLTKERDEAGAQAKAALEGVIEAARGVYDPAVTQAIEALQATVRDAESARRPEQATAAAKSAEVMAARVLGLVEEVRSSRDASGQEADELVARAAGSLDPSDPRRQRLQDWADGVRRGGPDAEAALASLKAAVSEMAAEAEAESQASAQALRASMAQARGAVVRAEKALEIATTPEVVEAVQAARDAAALVAEASDPEAAEVAVLRARERADAAHNVAIEVRTSSEVQLHELQDRAVQHAARAEQALIEADTDAVRDWVSKANTAAAAAKSASDVEAAKLATSEAQQAADAAHEAARQTLGDLQSLRQAAQATRHEADEILATVPLTQVRAEVHAASEAAEAVAVAADLSEAQAALERSQQAVQRAREAAATLLDEVRSRAVRAAEHARMRASEHPDSRQQADAAEEACQEASKATSHALAVVAAERAEAAARSAEVGRASAALARASRALDMAGSNDVRARVAACRDAVAAAETAEGLQATIEAADAAVREADAAREAANLHVGEVDALRHQAEEILAGALQLGALSPGAAPPSGEGLSSIPVLAEALETVAKAVELVRNASGVEAAQSALEEARTAARTAHEVAESVHDRRRQAKEQARLAAARAVEALGDSDHPEVAAAVEAAKEAALQAAASVTPDDAEEAAQRAEEAADRAVHHAQNQRSAHDDAVARAQAALEQAEAVLRDTGSEAVRNAVELTRAAYLQTEAADDPTAATAAADEAEKALAAVHAARERDTRKQLALLRERAAAAVHRSNVAVEQLENPRVRAQATAARAAAERVGSATAIGEATAAVEAAEAAADDAQAVIEGAIEVARHRATQAANRLGSMDGSGPTGPALQSLTHTGQRAASEALKASSPADAEEAAARAEAALEAALEAVENQRKSLEDAQARAAVARNRAEEHLTDPPLPSVAEAVAEARSAADDAIAATDPALADQAARRAEAAADRARDALAAQVSKLDVCRTRAREALKRTEKALWEADLESIRACLKDARAGVRQAVNTEDLPTAERGAARAEQAADNAEAALRGRKERVDRMRSLALDSVRRAEDALRITGSAEVRELVEQARQAAARASEAVEPEAAELQANQAVAAAKQARAAAEEAAEARAAARRRAQRGVAQAEAALVDCDLPRIRNVVAAAKAAAAEAETAGDPVVANAAADRAEAAAREAEQAVADHRGAVEAGHERVRSALKRARAALNVAQGSEVDAQIDIAVAAAKEVADSASLAEIETTAIRVEAAAVAAEKAATEAVERCRHARLRAQAAAERARAALEHLDHPTVREHSEAADEAALHAEGTLDPDAAEAAADVAEDQAKRAQTSLQLARAKATATRAHQLVADAAPLELPDGAPPDCVAMTDEVWSLSTEVHEAVAAAERATSVEEATEHAERAAKAAARALAARDALTTAIAEWRQSMRDTAQGRLEPLAELLQRLESANRETSTLAATPEQLQEAQTAKTEAQAAATAARGAAEIGDVAGVDAAMATIRNALRRSQDVLMTVRGAVTHRERKLDDDLVRALEVAGAASRAMVARASEVLSADPAEDLAWHARRAIESANAASDAAAQLRSGYGDVSKHDIEQLERRIVRAAKALDAATQGRGPQSSNEVLTLLKQVRSARFHDEAPTPTSTFSQEPYDEDVADAETARADPPLTTVDIDDIPTAIIRQRPRSDN
ncbi:MAG: hypothetical protein KTR31_02165 [Myxococcales bacterium]|nr:hypothetical protein [Myxococcales bacterium]